MVQVRRFDEKSAELYKVGKNLELPHLCIGQEAIGVGACYNLRDDDFVMPSHRDRAVYFLHGMPIDKYMAGKFGRIDGPARSKDHPHHVGDTKLGILPMGGVLGSAIPISVGVALASKLRKTEQVTLCFFGDSTTNRGDFHEGVNLAAVLKLPIVFICQNNLYALSTHISRAMAIEDIAERAKAYGIPGVVVDGNNVTAVYETVQMAISRARIQEGPTLIECKTYRWAAHCEHPHYYPDFRPQEEIEHWKSRDPIQNLETLLLEKEILTKEAIAEIEKEAASTLEDAVSYADQSPWPTPEEALHNVYAVGPKVLEPEVTGVKTITYAQAINEALREEMRKDDTVFLLGEDIGAFGGIFGVTKGLYEEFGPDRVIDTPVSESAIVGAGAGAALVGMHPVVEVMFADFLTIAMEQFANYAAKFSYMHDGDESVPLVVRTAIGSGGGGACHHSQSPEAWFFNVPGLKIIMPSTPYDAKGLLKTAIHDNNPILFFEHRALYSVEGPVPEAEFKIPLGKADIKKNGTDLTIVAIGVMVSKALSAATHLAENYGISCEVIDPRTLIPLDRETIIQSVKKTRKLLIAHEAPKTGGIGGEITSIVAEEALSDVDTIIRVAAPDTPIPFSPPLERFYIPDEKKIINAIMKVFNK